MQVHVATVTHHTTAGIVAVVAVVAAAWSAVLGSLRRRRRVIRCVLRLLLLLLLLSSRALERFAVLATDPAAATITAATRAIHCATTTTAASVVRVSVHLLSIAHPSPSASSGWHVDRVRRCRLMSGAGVAVVAAPCTARRGRHAMGIRPLLLLLLLLLGWSVVVAALRLGIRGCGAHRAITRQLTFHRGRICVLCYTTAVRRGRECWGGFYPSCRDSCCCCCR